jgi:hypothetical protein
VEVSQSGWAGLAEAVERTASEINEQEVSNTLDALGLLPAAATELSPLARKHLEAAAERQAPNMTSEGRRMTLRGCEKLELKTPSAFHQENFTGRVACIDIKSSLFARAHGD